MITNPYQDVIDWLRSPEGERWSEERMLKAKAYMGDHSAGLTAYGCGTLMIWKGLFSIKYDDQIVQAVFRHPREQT